MALGVFSVSLVEGRSVYRCVFIIQSKDSIIFYLLGFYAFVLARFSVARLIFGLKI